MFSHQGRHQNIPAPEGSGAADSRRRQFRKTRSLSFVSGFSAGKRLALLFAILNFLALLQYRNLMSRTLLESIKQYDDDMIGNYHFNINNIDSTRKTPKNGLSQQFSELGTKDKSGNSDEPESEININAKSMQDIHSQQGQYPSQSNNATGIMPTPASSSENKDNSGKFAYAFLIGGVMSKKEGTDYRGGLYGVVVAAHNLRLQGSKADVVLMVQMSATTNETRLSELEETLLKAMNIRIIYLPKVCDPKIESFYSLMMEKFRILQMEEYSRVLYLDADILPLCNLDYVMELSEQGDLLRENVVVAYKGEPASGGFFVLKPSASDYQELVQIINTTESRYVQLEYPHWNITEGWGHIIDESDTWMTIKEKNGTNWDFYGAQADQGLLYYWTKYYKKSVSLIIRNTVEQWGTESGTNNLQLLSTGVGTLKDYACVNPERYRTGWDLVPLMNYVHFTGRAKPWYLNRTILEESMRQKQQQNQSLNEYEDHEYWFWLLKDALRKTGLQEKVSLDFITKLRRQPSIGKTPSFDQRAQHIRRKAKNGWEQYESETAEGSNHSDQNRKSGNNEGKSASTKLDSSNLSTQTKWQAMDVVALLENFQPKKALKPYLPLLRGILDDVESSPGALAQGSLPSSQEKVTRTKIEPIHNGAPDTRKWAYVFLLGGARSDTDGTEYIGGLYSVVTSAHQLRKLGSRADIILMVQIAAESPHDKLKEFEEEILEKMNVKVIYIPKFANASLECFYSLMMEKFRILQLTDYSRVMYLDYDVLPTCNLDYLFELSDPLPDSSGSAQDATSFRLKENVIMSYQREPSSGGVFILKPNLKDYNHIQRIIYERESRSLELPFPHWDPIYGWGHAIKSPDYWKDIRGRKNTTWTWYGVKADQGLLYYWTKYVKKSVSIITRDDVEQWDIDSWEMDANHSLVLRQGQENGAPKIIKKALKNYGCPITHFLPAPYNDFFHMTGRSKPWFQTHEHLQNPNCTDRHERECKIQVEWYGLLKDALVSIGVLDRFSWDFLGSKKMPPVGVSPGDDQIAMYMIARKSRNWNQYLDGSTLRWAVRPQ